jgi:hypothetical protein
LPAHLRRVEGAEKVKERSVVPSPLDHLGERLHQLLISADGLEEAAEFTLGVLDALRRQVEPARFVVFWGLV